MRAVDVLIITALKEELDALIEMTEGVSGWTNRVERETGPYFVGHLEGRRRAYRVVAARLTKMAGVSAAAKATRLVEYFSPRCLAMCGVCAGHPEDTAIGDVVIGERVFQHDEGKLTAAGLAGDLWVRELNERWLHVAQDLAGPATAFPGFEQPGIDSARWWVLEQLFADRDPLKSVGRDRYLYGRRSEVLQGLIDKGLVALDGDCLALTSQGRQVVGERRVIHGAGVQNAPYHVLVGPIGSGNAVVGTPDVWDRLAKGGMRKTLAIEMEGAALAHVAHAKSLPFVIVKGVMDHADEHKADGAKSFAAQVSAAVLCQFLANVLDLENQSSTIEQSSADLGSWAAPEYRRQLGELVDQRKELLESDADTSKVDEAILDLRRRARDGWSLEPGVILSDRYRLLDRVGVGGFASVWRALDERQGRAVALKVLHSQWTHDRSRVDRFVSGVRRMHGLRHPAIAAMLTDAVSDESWQYCVMEWFSNGDLRRSLASESISRRQALGAVARALDGLIYSHLQGIIHRDVKPSNILLDEKGLGYIADFDLAQAKDSTHGTRTGGMGTFVYAAPEQLVDAKSVGPSSDAYAAGMTTLFVLMGKDPPAVVSLVAQLKPGLLDDLDCGERLRRAIKGAVAYEVADRVTTCAELRAAILEELSFENDPEPEDDHEQQVGQPEWAEDFGIDEYGEWATFSFEGVEQRMRWISPGTFLMGSPDDEPGRFEREGPLHVVSLTEGFWMAETPCTQALWEAVVGENPSRFVSPTRPVEQVSWDEVQKFLKRLEVGVGPGFSLPTEAQWEYACRAGTTEATYGGAVQQLGENHAPVLDTIAWYAGNSGVDFDLEEGEDSSVWPEKEHQHERAGTRQVGQKRPNAWGLFDMLGNVWEWCATTQSHYRAAELSNPTPSIGTHRVFRGGSWQSDPRMVRAAFRNWYTAEFSEDNAGFRLVRAHDHRAPSSADSNSQSSKSPRFGRRQYVAGGVIIGLAISGGLLGASLLRGSMGTTQPHDPVEATQGGRWDSSSDAGPSRGSTDTTGEGGVSDVELSESGGGPLEGSKSESELGSGALEGRVEWDGSLGESVLDPGSVCPSREWKYIHEDAANYVTYNGIHASKCAKVDANLTSRVIFCAPHFVGEKPAIRIVYSPVKSIKPQQRTYLDLMCQTQRYQIRTDIKSDEGSWLEGKSYYGNLQEP